MNSTTTSAVALSAPAVNCGHEEFIKQLVQGAKHYHGSNRRAEARHAVGMAVRAVPVNAAQQPVGDTFVAVTRDISVKGVALYHTQPILAPFLSLEFPLPDGGKRQTLLQVLRSRPVGPLFEIAGQFIG